MEKGTAKGWARSTILAVLLASPTQSSPELGWSNSSSSPAPWIATMPFPPANPGIEKRNLLCLVSITSILGRTGGVAGGVAPYGGGDIPGFGCGPPELETGWPTGNV